MKFTEFTEGDNKKVTDETIVNEAEPAFKLDIQTQYPTPANDNRAPTTTKSNVVDLNQYRDELKKLDNAGQKELQNYIKKNKSLWSRLSGWGAKTAGRHAGATVASTVTGPLSPAVAAVANLALLGYDVYTLGNTIYDWAKGNDVDLPKADSKNATGSAPFTVPPRPTSQGGRNKRIDRWDRLYGKTHNPDGTAIEVDRPPFVPPLGPAPGFKPGNVNTDKIDITTPSSDTPPNIQDPSKLGDPAPAGDSVEFDPNIVGDPNIYIPNIPGPFKPPRIDPDDGSEIVIPRNIEVPDFKQTQKQKLDPPPVGKTNVLPTIGTPPASALKLNRNRKTPPTKQRVRPSRKFGGLPSSNQQKATYRLNPFTPLPMPDPMNLSRYKSFGESIDEREMTKKEKAKEKRLKKKYDDSDMKASMKKQYGKDWKTVYYATIRKQAMDEGYQILPSIDKARYDEIQGMEGPMMTASGKVLYYDPQEGAYYDRDSDMYLSYEEFKQYDEPMRADEGKTKVPDYSKMIQHMHSKDAENMKLPEPGMSSDEPPMSPNEVERQKRIGDGGGYSPPTKKPTSKKSTYMKPIISFPRDIPSFGTILQNAMERMNEAPGDEELLKPMVDMDPKVLPIYAKNIIKKYPHLKPSVNAMIGKNEAVATEAKQLKYNFAVVDANDFDTVIGFTTDLRDAKEMANRHTKNGISNGKIIKLKKPMSQKKGDMMINRPMDEASSPWTSSGKHPEDMDRDELEHEIDIFKQYKKAGMSLSPQEIMRMDSLYDYLDTVDDMVKVTNIKWDSDDDVSNLSTTMMVPVPPELDDEDAEEFIANYITDKTGMTHDGFMIGESNLNEGYEGEISAILQALDIEHHWSDGRLHVNKRDVDDVRDRLDDTDMEMPDITIYEDDMPYGAKVAAMGTAGAAGLYGAKKGIQKYGPAVVDKAKTAINNRNLNKLKNPKPQGSPSKLGKLAKVGKGVLGKAAWPIALGMAGYDAVRGYRADPNASFTQKMKNAGNTALDGISFGTLGKDATRESLQAQGFTVQDLKEKVDQFILVKENVDTMRKIVANKSAMPVKFEDGTMKVDMTTANIFLQAFDKMRDDNQAKVAEMMRTKKGFLRVMDIIYGAMR